jgi:hypothetical protein
MRRRAAIARNHQGGALLRGHDLRFLHRALAQWPALAVQARRWISETTKSGQTVVTVTPAAGELDAQRIEEPDEGVLAGAVGAARGHPGEPATLATGTIRPRDAFRCGSAASVSQTTEK